MVTVRLWWAETQDEDFLLAFRDVVVSVFGFGGNRIFEMDTTNFVWCRGGTRAIPVPCRRHYRVKEVTELAEKDAEKDANGAASTSILRKTSGQNHL